MSNSSERASKQASKHTSDWKGDLCVGLCVGFISRVMSRRPMILGARFLLFILFFSLFFFPSSLSSVGVS